MPNPVIAEVLRRLEETQTLLTQIDALKVNRDKWVKDAQTAEATLSAANAKIVARNEQIADKQAQFTSNWGALQTYLTENNV